MRRMSILFVVSVLGCLRSGPAASERAAPECALPVIATPERQNHRQGDLALAEIIANGLAEFRLLGRIVEHVID